LERPAAREIVIFVDIAAKRDEFLENKGGFQKKKTEKTRGKKWKLENEGKFDGQTLSVT